MSSFNADDARRERSSPRYSHFMFMGKQAVREKRLDEARHYLIQATELVTTDPAPWLWLARTTRDRDQILEYLEHAVAADPFDPQARGELSRFRALIEGEKPAGPQPQPAPSQPRQAAGRTYTCDRCGGHLRYDPGQHQLVCEQCQSTYDVDAKQAPDDGRSLDLVLARQRGHSWAAAHHEVECSQCGAVSLLPPGKKSERCPYCESNQLVEVSKSESLVPPDALAPIRVSPKKARQLLKDWLRKGLVAPDNLGKVAGGTALHAAYYPFWVFDATFHGNWTAEVNEGHGDFDRWVPRSGEEILFFDDIVVPATDKISIDDAEKVAPWALEQARAYRPEMLTGWPAFTYTRSISDASLEARHRAVKDSWVKIERKVAIGKEIRNFNLNGDFSGQTFKLTLLPLYVAHYDFSGRTYNVLINGITGKIGGRKPVDQLKVWMLVLMALIALGLLAGVAWTVLSNWEAIFGVPLGGWILP